MASPGTLSEVFQHLVGGGRQRVGGHAEHPPSKGVVGLELVAPVGDGSPLGVPVEGVRDRFVEGIRVVERPTADACSGQDEDVTQDVDALDAVEADPGREEKTIDRVEGR